MTAITRACSMAFVFAMTAISSSAIAAEGQASNDFAFIYGKHDAEWRSCHSDDDCALIVTHSACELKLPVNRNNFDRASSYAAGHESCQSPVPDVKGTDYSTSCKARQCVLLKKRENP